MNDIQEKENIYNATTKTANKQQEAVNLAKHQVNKKKEEYLQSVIRAATLDEKLRRRKDLLTYLLIFGVVGILALILLLVDNVIGIIFIIVATIIVWAIKQRFGDDIAEDYKERRAFFKKYAKSIPANEQLKWKDDMVSIGSTNSCTDGWVCSKCSTHNSNGSAFCTSCGEQKQLH